MNRGELFLRCGEGEIGSLQLSLAFEFVREGY